MIPIDMLDKEVQKAIRKAEKSDGFKYGAQVHSTRGECFVSVQFYPKRQWYVTFKDTKEIIVCTKELMSNIKQLKL